MNDLAEMLLDIFEQLRQKRVPVGMDEYGLALKVVSDWTNAKGIPDLLDPSLKAKVQSLCRLFWAKSPEDQALFDEIFTIESHMHLQAAIKKEQQDTRSLEHASTDDAVSTNAPHSTSSGASIANTQPPKPQEPEYSLQRQSVGVPRTGLQFLSASSMKALYYKGSMTYHLTPRSPMNKREMAGIWRKLRYFQQEGFSRELDVEGTSRSFAQTGFLLKAILKSRRRNQAGIVILLDQGGSMEPFALFIGALLESILRSGSFRHVNIFYFHNVPEGYLYTRPMLLGSVSLESVLTEYCQGKQVLIISDAGAARGHYDSTRLHATKTFLDQLDQSTYLSAWLNPLPKSRWTGTTAWYIAKQVPMFQLDWEGLNDVVNVLRGQSFSGAQNL